jgi:lipid-binding SYLF domain-containing protein
LIPYLIQRQEDEAMKRVFVSVLITVFALLPMTRSYAASAAELDQKANQAIETFRYDVNGADVFLKQAAGYLIFPRVIKVGIGIGAETGEGVLRVNGRSAAYYRTTSGSFGLQLGAQAKSMIIAFMTKESLAKFLASSGWQVGVDGSVALIDLGAGKQINSGNIKDPVVGFIFGSKGLMYNLTLEGTKITRIKK